MDEDAGIYARESTYLDRYVQLGIAQRRVISVSFPSTPTTRTTGRSSARRWPTIRHRFSFRTIASATAPAPRPHASSRNFGRWKDSEGASHRNWFLAVSHIPESTIQHDVSKGTVGYLGGATLPIALPVVLEAVIAAGMATWEQTGTAPWWLPTVGMHGETGALYAGALELLSVVVSPALVFILGYRYGQARTDDTEN